MVSLHFFNRLFFLSCCHFVRKCNEYLVFLIILEQSSYFRTEVCNRMMRRINIPGTYHTTAAVRTYTRRSTTEFYCFLWLLAAVVRLHRTRIRACSHCVADLPPDIVTAKFAPVICLFQLRLLFSQNQPESTLEFYETSLKAAAA